MYCTGVFSKCRSARDVSTGTRTDHTSERTNVMRRVLRDVTYTQGRVFVHSALLRLSLTLQGVSAPMSYGLRMTHRQELHERRLPGTIRANDSDTTDHQIV